MSKTELKNGAIVEGAIKDVALCKRGVWRGYFTVGEVARYANMSKPTVLKYINILCEAGHVVEQERDMRYCGRNTTRQFLYVEE